MPELSLPGATLVYRQSGAGPDVVWLAAGDNPGDNWRRFQTPAELAANGHFHLLPGLGHSSAFGHRPQEVNDCLRAIIDQECDRS